MRGVRGDTCTPFFFWIARSEAKAFNREDREGIAKLAKKSSLIFS
jgi:hypothetical protein